MSIQGEIRTLYSDREQTQAVFPRTKMSAVSDENGVGLNVRLENISNYAKKVGNPHNLLDNSDFRNPVNQRGRLSYDAYGYTIDRWIINGGSVSVENGYVTNSGGMIQRLPKHTANAVYTFACKNVDGTIEVLSDTFESNASNNSAQMSIGASSGLPYIHLLPGSYLWVALYEGEYTVETLPEYQPKGYGVELVECMRYYQVFAARARSVPGSTNVICYPFQFAMPMRIAPTVTALNGVENIGIGEDIVTPYGASVYVVASTSGDGILKASFSADL